MQATVVELKRWERRGKAGRKEERARERTVGGKERENREGVSGCQRDGDVKRREYKERTVRVGDGAITQKRR